jgi:hypothetical protein
MKTFIIRGVSKVLCGGSSKIRETFTATRTRSIYVIADWQVPFLGTLYFSPYLRSLRLRMYN